MAFKDFSNADLKLFFNDEFQGDLHVTQHDTGREITVQVIDNQGKIINTTGLTIRLYISNHVNAGYVDGTTVNEVEGIYKIVIPNGLLTIPGKLLAQFQLLEATTKKKISSALLNLYVEKSIETGATVGQDIWMDFAAIQAKVDQVLNSDAYQKMAEVSASIEQIDAKITEANSVKSQLSVSIANASAALVDIGQYRTVKDQLTAVVSEANTAKNQLETAITNANTNKDTAVNAINTAIQSAETAKTNLDGSISTSTSRNTTLASTNSTALTRLNNLNTAIANAQTEIDNLNAITGLNNLQTLGKFSESADGKLLFGGDSIIKNEIVELVEFTIVDARFIPNSYSTMYYGLSESYFIYKFSNILLNAGNVTANLTLFSLPNPKTRGWKFIETPSVLPISYDFTFLNGHIYESGTNSSFRISVNTIAGKNISGFGVIPIIRG